MMTYAPAYRLSFTHALRQTSRQIERYAHG